MKFKKTTALLLALLLVLAYSISPALAAEDEGDDVDLLDIPTVYTYLDCHIGACTCTDPCHIYYKNYEYLDKSMHTMAICCSGCGVWALGGGKEAHTFSGKTCIYCGYSEACSHSSTTKDWVTGCDWEETCIDCGEVVNSDTTHGPYDYSSWAYYNATQHRRSYTCSYGDSGTYYETENHSTTRTYSQHSATQHAVSSYCAGCSSTVGSTTYANHSFTYGSWESDSDSQHRRLKTCSTCGYSEYEYVSHSYSYGSWTSVSDWQHERSGACTCGHQSIQQADHTDTNDVGYCDTCTYLMTRFSVTLPASLSMTVSQNGVVHAATNAAIVNNSTGAVRVTALTVTAENGWALVPYDTNMATAKVDAKRIGFSLNGAKTTAEGSTEQLGLDSDWTIAQGGSLPLRYDAVVSAMSAPVNEQVLTLVFVLDWAG